MFSQGKGGTKTCKDSRVLIIFLIVHSWAGTIFNSILVGGPQQSRQFSSVPFDHAWNMRPKFGVEDQLKAYKIHFAKDMGFACLDSIRLSLSGSAQQDEIKSCTAVLMHTSSPARFSNYGIFIPKVRAPSSSHKKIINIVELCPTVDSSLERTSEGNPSIQYVDQVQNPTKNPFTYLMSTAAFFKLQMICFVVHFLINS